MENKIILKLANQNDIEREISSVGFDDKYIKEAKLKYEHKTYKIFNLKAVEANILKQLSLSLGFDCAVSRDTITCKCEFTDCIISASISQFKKLVKKLYIQPFRLKNLAKLIKDDIESTLKPLRIRETVLYWDKPLIMGILNVTPDSFSDGGNYFDKDNAIGKALELIIDGADIIDIGGESTRPGATPVSTEDELARITPVVEAIREKNTSVIISVDTRNYLTAKTAIEAGADVINDVSGLSYDQQLLDYVCNKNIPVIIMHSDKVPAVTAPEDFEYDIVEEIYKFFDEKIELLLEKGLSRSKIIIDPGIGFGKSINDNFEILKRIDEFRSLNCPILMGISRKSFISNSFELTKEKLDEVSILYGIQLIAKGINIIRVHDVFGHKKSLDYLSKLL